MTTLLAGSCGGSGDKDTQADKAAQTKTEGKQVFQASWSTNAAPPPEVGEIREIGSIFDSASFETLGMANKTPPKQTAPSVGPVDPSASTWTIALGVFRGDNSVQEANQALAIVRTQGKLPAAFVQRRGATVLVAYGSYTGPDDARAQSDLAKIQTIDVNGSAAYVNAYLCPPFKGQGGSQIGQYDLRRARQQYGENALYTLQVGTYGRDDINRATEADLVEIRKAAEDAVARLRAEGELAYYFHGPNRSMVLVGLFNSDDFDPVNRPGVESPRLKETRKRYPLNLYNGAGYRYKSKGMKEAKLMSSGLVAVPAR